MVSRDRVIDYVRALTACEDPPLAAARRKAEEAGIPVTALESVALIAFLARQIGASTAVEIGAGAGYSGIWLARALKPKGHLTTIESDPDRQRLAVASYREAGLGEQVRAILGGALEVLPRLAERSYDLVYIDAAKSEYPAYLNHALRLLRPGGIIAADNVFWQGKVADPLVDDEDTKGIRAFNARIVEEPALDTVILPIGDGLSISLLISPTD